MSMTVQDMRDYVRSFLDTDDEELPDALVDVWREEGCNNITRAFEPWDFYESLWSVDIDDTGFVAFTSISNDDGDEVDSITGVLQPAQFELQYTPHPLAQSKYAWGNTTSSGWCSEFSIFKKRLYVWPVPTDTTSFSVRGYRKPVTPTLATESCDLPDEFHPLVCEWMLVRAYERQDDDVMSRQKQSTFEQKLETLRRRYTRGPHAGIQAIGRKTADRSLPSRFSYDWE